MYFLLAMNWENGQSQHSNQRWGNMMVVDQHHVHNQFYYFCHQILDECVKIMFIISMNNTSWNNTNFIFITFPNSKIRACKSYNLELDTQPCHPLSWNSPTMMCGDAAIQSSVVYIITNRLTVITLNFTESTLSFLLHIISYLCVFE